MADAGGLANILRIKRQVEVHRFRQSRDGDVAKCQPAFTRAWDDQSVGAVEKTVENKCGGSRR